MNPEEQSRIFADYYEKLAVPSNEEHYDEDYLELMNNIIKQQIDTCNITIFSEEEIIKAVDKLNSGKTADEYSLTAEHFIYAGRSISPNIVSLFNNIMQTGEIPKVFKTGILTPVHKKGKDSTLPTNYREINVTSALGKVFEYALLDKMIDLNSNQSELQFGFTQGLSPIMAALIVSDGIVHAKQQNLNMFLATLDKLERRGLGLNIGLEYCGSPLCADADDIVLMTTDETETQAMLNIAYKFSCQHCYNIHPEKSTLIKTERIKTSKQQHPITLGEKPIKEDQQTTHLGIIRARALPIEAELHKRQLSLLYSILASENTKLKNVMERQMTVNAGNSDSFFSRAQEILNFYNLPSIAEFKKHLPSKIRWKKDINRSIADKWSNFLQKEMEEKSTLKHCNIQILKIHEVHPVWRTLPPVTYEVKRANIKAMFLTGTYLLQEHIQRFNGNSDEQKMPAVSNRTERLNTFPTKMPSIK
ncbi:unnamed protein product [Mytilus coruscus]|uniref:Reverse transcriptase domain-containing protein n=1 Tax=Mytilus coruscus TaxID=42192 RepID=A0A6J8EQ32_MYTCO|nr:unnamed protein product [Mytilus coruscus]